MQIQMVQISDAQISSGDKLDPGTSNLLLGEQTTLANLTLQFLLE